MTEKVIAKVFTYDPSVSKEPVYNVYEVPWKKWITVLEVLRYIYENIYPIAFDWGCRIARCGTCGILVNKKAVLACATFAKPGKILIEPLQSLRIVKDLIVDRTAIESKLLAIKPWLIRSKPLTEIPIMPYDIFQRVEGLQLCIDCLLCNSVCPVLHREGIARFAGPNILMKISMRYYDPRDEAKKERLETAIREGLFRCTLCGRCTDVCPRGRGREAEPPAITDALDAEKACARRFNEAPLLDHVVVLQDLQERAKKLLNSKEIPE